MMRNLILLLCASLSTGVASAALTTATWLGAGDYLSSANWDINTTPVNGNPSGATYNVIVGSGSITLDLSPTVNAFSLSNAQLTVSGTNTRTITASTTFGTGAVIAGGTLGLAGSASLTAVNTDTFLNINSGARVINNGTFTHAATGTGQTAIVLDASGTGSAVFENAAAGTFTANTQAGDASVGYGAVNSGNLFLNEGTFTKTGTHDYAVNVAFENTGTVNVQQGSLTINAGDGGTTAGTFSLSSGATLAVGGGMAFSSGASVTGAAGTMQLKNGALAFNAGSTFSAGNLQVLAGTATFAAGSTLGTTALTMSGGTLQLDIDHTFTGASLGSGGIIIGSGHVTLANPTLGSGNYVFGGTGIKEFTGTTAFTTAATDQFLNVDGGTEVRNSGTFTQTRNGSGNSSIILNADSAGGTSVFRNATGAIFNANMAAGDGSVGYMGASAGNSFINEGTFNKTGSFAYAFNVPLVNSGSMSVQAGVLNVNTGGTTTGSVAISSGASLGLNGTQQFQSGSAITGAGTVQVNGGTTTFQSGSSFGAANLQAWSGTTAFLTGSTLGTTNLTLSGGTLQMDIDHTFTGATFANGGSVIGSGHTTFSSPTFDQNTYTFGGTGVKEFTGTTQLSTNFINQFFNINGGAEVKNSGSFTQTRTGSGSSQIVLNADSAGGSSTFLNATGATFTANMSGGAGGIGAMTAETSAQFVNQGTFTKTGTQDYDVGVAFANSGSVSAQQGSLYLLGGDGGSTTGSASVSNGASLFVNGGFSFGNLASISGQGTFQSNGGTTAFNSGSSFSASNLKIAGGTTSFGVGSTLSATSALTLVAGTLQMDIDHTFTAAAISTGTTVSGAGVTTFAGTTPLNSATLTLAGNGLKKFSGTTTFTPGAIDSFLNIDGGAQVSNTGSFTQMRDGSGASQIVLNADSAGGTSTFLNATGATFTANMSGGDGGISAVQASTSNKFTNQGTFNKTGSHDYDVNVAFANSGTVSISGGNLDLLGGDGGSTTGSFTVPNGSNLIVNGGFSFGNLSSVSGQGTFQSNGGTTAFGSGSSFSASNLKVVGGTTSFGTGSTLSAGSALTITGGTLQMDIDHTFNSPSISTGATISGAGTTTLAGTPLNGVTLTLAGSGLKKFSGTTSFTPGAIDSFLNINGGAQASNTGTFTQTRDASGASQIVLNANSAGGTSTFLNAAGATFNANMTGGDGGVSAGLASTSNKFTNQGTFNKTGSHDYDVNVAFANSGTVSISGGNLDLLGGDGGSTTGSFTVPNGSNLIVNGGFSFGNLSSVSGQGTFQSNGGTTAFGSGSSFSASSLKVVGGTTSFGTGSTLNAASALAITGGTLQMDIDHTFNSPSISTGATISGAGVTTLAGTPLNGVTLTLAGSGLKKFSGTTSFTPGAIDSFLNINGGAQASNIGTFTQTRDASGASQIVLNADSAGGTSTFLNATGATFNANMTGGDGGVSAGLASTSDKFTNQGTFNKTGSHDYDVYVAFANSGTVTISGGNLDLLGGDGGSTTGSFAVPTSSSLIVSGGFSFGNLSSVSGQGTFQSNGGTTAFGSGSSFSASNLKVVGGTTSFGTGSTLNAASALTITGGTLQMDIDHTFTSPSISTGATISGAGITTFAGTNTLNATTFTLAGSGLKKFSGATSFTPGAIDSFLNINGGAQASNTGTFTQTRDASGASQIVLNANSAGGTSTFLNATGATFTANMTGGDGGVSAGLASTSNKFTNQGTFNKTGTHEYDVNVAFANSGSVTIQQGNLDLIGGDGGSTTGSFSIPGGSDLVVNGGFAFGNLSTVSGAGTFQSNGGTTAFNSGSTFSASNLTVVGGTTSFGTGSTLNAASALTITGGTLQMDIDHTFNGASISSGATISGAGATNFAGTTALNAASVTISGSGVKTFSGSTTFAPGEANSFFNIAGGAEVINTGNFTQYGSSGGSSGIVLASNGTGTATFLNQSNFTANIATGTATIGYGVLNANNKFVNSNTFTKTGAGTYQMNVAVDNSGKIEVSQGTLSITAGVTDNAGTLLVDSGATLDLSENAHPSATGFLTNNGAALKLGTNNITVASDYQNANFGSGNNFNGRANVTGTAQILAATGSSLAYGGNVTSGAIQFGTVHVGDDITKSYTIQNTGTVGVAVRGAIQNTVGGASITDPRLSGSGLLASDFDLTQGSSTSSGAVTFDATTPGVLSGQQLHVATNFDNVSLSNLAIQGTANYYADPVWSTVSGTATLAKLSATSYTLSFGTISLESGALTAGLELLNQMLDATYQDALNGTFNIAGVTHFTLSGFNSFSNIASGSSDNGLSITLNPSADGNGTFSDTLILNPTSSNVSNTSSLSAIQINIQATVVPEPGVTALLLIGGAMLVAVRQGASGRRAAGASDRD